MNQALLIVDLQNDFLPKGALAVPHGDEIIPIINQLASYFKVVVTSLDWHPSDHVSFASTWDKTPQEIHENQILWPTHCVANTQGSQHPSSFKKERVQKAFYKGNQKDVDSYSIFFDQSKKIASDIDAYLKKKKIKDLFIVGLATDYCVLETALDAKSLGYNVFVIEDGCKAVNLKEGDEEKSYNIMKKRGISIVKSKDILALAPLEALS